MCIHNYDNNNNNNNNNNNIILILYMKIWHISIECEYNTTFYIKPKSWFDWYQLWSDCLLIAICGWEVLLIVQFLQTLFLKEVVNIVSMDHMKDTIKHIYIHVYICNDCMHLCTCVNSCMYLHVHMCTCVYMCVYSGMYTYMYIYSNITEYYL